MKNKTNQNKTKAVKETCSRWMQFIFSKASWKKKICQNLNLDFFYFFFFLKGEAFPHIICIIVWKTERLRIKTWNEELAKSISGYVSLAFLSSAAEQIPRVLILFHFLAMQVHITFLKMRLWPYNPSWASWAVFLSKMRHCGKYNPAQREKKIKKEYIWPLNHSSHKSSL